MEFIQPLKQVMNSDTCHTHNGKWNKPATKGQVLLWFHVHEGLSCGSDSTPSWEPPYAAGVALKSKKKKKIFKVWGTLLGRGARGAKQSIANPAEERQAGIWDAKWSPPCLGCYLWHSLWRPKHGISGGFSTWRNLCNCLPGGLHSTPHTTGVL